MKYEDFVKSMHIDPANKDLDAKLVEVLISLPSETGELLEHFKKYIRDGKELNIENIILELGDVLFSVTHLGILLGVSLENIMEANVRKLTNRRKNIDESVFNKK